MKIQITLLSFLATALLALTACSKPKSPDAGTASPAVETQQPPAVPGNESSSLDSWLGQWNGPEGTFLVVSKNQAGYAVKIQSLDGPADYEARQVNGSLEFERNGKTETIRATDGKATGMKWLQDKTDCLTITSGEGFCRG